MPSWFAEVREIHPEAQPLLSVDEVKATCLLRPNLRDRMGSIFSPEIVMGCTLIFKERKLPLLKSMLPGARA
jgi:hypothetical protein